MRKYEYKIIDSNDVSKAGFFKGRQRVDIEAYLCAIGDDGWEIINVDFCELGGDNFDFRGVAKREVFS